MQEGYRAESRGGIRPPDNCRLDKSRFICNPRDLRPPVHSDEEADNGDVTGRWRNKARRERPWARKRKIPLAYSVLSKRCKGSGPKAQSKNGAAAAASSGSVKASTSASSSKVDNAAAAKSDEVNATGTNTSVPSGQSSASTTSLDSNNAPAPVPKKSKVAAAIGADAKQPGAQNGSSSSHGKEVGSNGEPAADLIQRHVLDFSDCLRASFILFYLLSFF